MVISGCGCRKKISEPFTRCDMGGLDRRPMLLTYSPIGAVAAALFFPLPASAGSAITNPGGKYVPYGPGVGKFHTNPGGKYVYRGYGSKFRTNPGGKYVYPGWRAWR